MDKYHTIIDILDQRCNSQGDSIAYSFVKSIQEKDNQTISYNQLKINAQYIGSYLQNNFKPRSRIILLFPAGLEFVTAFYGCMYAGMIPICLQIGDVFDTKKVLQRMEGIIEDAQVSIIMTVDTIKTQLERVYTIDKQETFKQQTVKQNSSTIITPSDSLLNKIITLEEIKQTHEGGDFKKTVINPESIAYLQYSSGSTGNPKGIMITHHNLISNLEALTQAFNYQPDSVSLSWVPHNHDLGLVKGILQPLYSSIPAYILSPLTFLKRPIRWLEIISHYRITHVSAPTFAYDYCVQNIDLSSTQHLNLTNWLHAGVGAEPIKHNIITQFSNKFKSVGFRADAFRFTYGLAEATLCCAVTKLNQSPIFIEVKAKALSQNQVEDYSAIDERENKITIAGCGHSVLDTTIIVVNPTTLTKSKPNQIGEIWIKSPSVAQGYWQKPQLTEEVFNGVLADNNEAGFLKTGDLGFIRDNELFVTGRIKDLIIIRGQNYYPQDIETTLEQVSTQIRTNCTAVFALEKEDEEKIVVVAEVKSSKNLDGDNLINKIREAIAFKHELSIYAVVLIRAGTIPKTTSGKIQRYACKAQFINQTLDIIAIDYIGKSTQELKISIQQSSLTDLEFSLLYFSSNEAEFENDKYQLLLEGAKFADHNDFTAVWLPERHFHPFGGIYPNPSVLASALAMTTKNIRIRAGSVVIPLQNPVRVAEDWSVVDNLSQGRVDLAFARGWNPNDFVLAPDNYHDRTAIFHSGIKTVQKLWQGESINLPNGVGKETSIKIYPLPKQKQLPTWITCSGGKERFLEAGATGANILTALLFQSLEELAEKINIYRQSRADNGYDPNTGKVTLMLHTFIGEDFNWVRNKVKKPFQTYLKSSVDLWSQEIKSLDNLSKKDEQNLLDTAFERYFQTSALFGTPESCLEMVNSLEKIGVNEIACLIDFGIEFDSVIPALYSLKKLRDNQKKDNFSGLNTSSSSTNQDTNEEINYQIKSQKTVLNKNYNLESSSSAISNFNSQQKLKSNSINKQIVPPNNEVERILAKIWQKVFKIENPYLVSIQDNFFIMGGDSLKAVNFVKEIEAIFAQEFPLSRFFEHPTIEKLAQLIQLPTWEEEKSNSSLVSLKSTGNKRPFFYVHPASGSVLVFGNIARHFDFNRPLYGLQAVGIDGKKEPLKSIEAMATDYIKQIKTVQPQGPYLIGGRCWGGLVAFEMAQQLVAENERVDGLILIEAPYDRRNIIKLSMMMRQNKVPNSSDVENIEQIRKIDVEKANYLQKLRDVQIKNRINYKPKVYSGKIHYFCATEKPRGELATNFGWKNLSQLEVENISVEGNHETIDYEPNVVILANELSKLLDKLDTNNTV